MTSRNTAEHRRLTESEARKADWKNWGPYLAERAWGTVREDYSEDGDAWSYFPHDHARSRAYRWNEDGLGGFCNRLQNICLAVALWNERDPFLKERLFGLSGPEGNHGEDVKEYYFYLDGTPTHSYMKMLYKYPQVEFPYARLVAESSARGRTDPEYELIDALRETFEQQRYFDVVIEYAKAAQDDIMCRVTAINRGPDPAPIHILPHCWYRNTWSWIPDRYKSELRATPAEDGSSGASTRHPHLGERFWYVRDAGKSAPSPLLFTENNTNNARLFGSPNATPHVKDGIHDAVCDGDLDHVGREQGSKVAGHIQATLQPGESLTAEARLSDAPRSRPFVDFAATFERRVAEADEFHASLRHPGLDEEESNVQRQAYAGLSWSKQFYHYAVENWLKGDPGNPAPPDSRKHARNADWGHLYNLDVLSMPDKWEYPWYAAWDLAFHMPALAGLDPEWAKRQLILMLREWYMHPNGQLPAYEWNFSDVNPPVHAWAAWRVYKISRNVTGHADTAFLERVFHKLLLNFTWWVNRKDTDGRNIFEGGFLGLDNIGVFDRSAPMPEGGHLEQSDATAWMAMYCLNMLAIALELARTRPTYEDVATKFFEHFVYIADAIDGDDERPGLWNEEDGFYYDVLHTPGGRFVPMRIRSFVGLIPLYAVETLEPDLLRLLPRFRKRMEWFIRYRPHLLRNIHPLTEPGRGGRLLLSIAKRSQLERLAQRMLDTEQFLSPFGLRSLSKEHETRPFEFRVRGEDLAVHYDPAESTSGLFGGNSNWRGPVWFPVNMLMIESLQRFHHYYGDSLKVEMPTGSGQAVALNHVASDLSRRLCSLFLRDARGRRPFNRGEKLFDDDPAWRDHVLFHEYFHGDTGAGLGASHQTGWTALVAKLLQQTGGRSR